VAAAFSILQTVVHHSQQVWVFQCGQNTFLVIELFVYFNFCLVFALLNVYVDLVEVRQASEQLDANHEPNQRGHAAVRNGGRELNAHDVVVFVNSHTFGVDDQ